MLNNLLFYNFYFMDWNVNFNAEIIKTFENLNVVKAALKDNQVAIRELFEDNDDLNELTHELEQIRLEVKPKLELVKQIKLEIQTKNIDLFTDKKSLTNQKNKLLRNLAELFVKKQEAKDEEPLYFYDAKWKRKELVIEVSSKTKLEKPLFDK